MYSQFCYNDRTNPLLPITEISNIKPSSMTVQTGLCRLWSKTPKTDFSCNEAHIAYTVQTSLCRIWSKTTKTGFSRNEAHVAYIVQTGLCPLWSKNLKTDFS